MNKTVLTSFTILCLLSIVFLMGLSLNIQTVKASGTIYIRADGSVEGTTNIVTADNVTYTLNAAINDSIMIERSNIIIDGAGHTVKGFSLTGEGFSLTNINNVTIKNLTIKGFWNGIYLKASSSNNIFGNNITANGSGIEFNVSSNHNMVSGNNITADNFVGIYSYESSSNTISENNITNNDYGIFLDESSSNTISENNITNNDGFGMLIHGSSNNTVSGNNIARNDPNVHLLNSSNNRFYHNNFIIGEVTCESSVNIWDDGYPSGGNYWSDYVHEYPDASELDGSDLWDTPYVIDGDNQDNYPIIPEFTSAVLLPMFIMLSTTAIALAKRKTTTKNKQ